MDVVALGELLAGQPEEINGDGKFRLVKVFRGDKLVTGKLDVTAPYFGVNKSDKKFLLMGTGTDEVLWSSPLPVTAVTERYLEDVAKLTDDGAERLRFFIRYLESPEPMLARDAYEEFAQSPYEEVKAIRDAMDRPQLLEWIQNPEIAPDRKRLYFTLLGVCGNVEDADLLEKMLRVETAEGRPGLDACIGCYLTLKGAAGLPLVDELFLKNEKCMYADTYAAVMALRFHGTEGGVIPRERVVESMRLMLERPDFADLVIPDLARWEDWSQVERLTKLFKEANADTSWVRVPVVNYLRACPLPEAKEKLIELEKIDPKAVKRAATFFPIPVPNSAPAKSTDDQSSSVAPSSNQESDSFRLPLGARNRQVAAANLQIVSDRSLVLAPAPSITVNHSMLVFVIALTFVAVGLTMWLVVRGEPGLP